MKRLVGLAAFAVSGCISMTPATYMVSMDAKVALQKFQGSKIAVGEVGNPPSFDPMCRAVGPVSLADGMPPASSSPRGSTTRLKYAGLHGEGGARLKGALTRPWRWDMAMHLVFADLRVYEDGLLVGQATYDAHGGGASFSKFGATAQKIRPLVDRLFARK